VTSSWSFILQYKEIETTKTKNTSAEYMEVYTAGANNLIKITLNKAQICSSIIFAYFEK